MNDVHDSAQRTSVPAYLLIVAWFAMVASAGELVLLARRKFTLHQVLSVSPHAPWMIPLSNLAIFLGAAAVLLLLARRWPRLRSYAGATLTWSFACLAALLLMLSRVHPIAALLLAGGLAWQLSQWSARRPVRVRRTLLATTPMLMVLFVVAAAASWRYTARTQLTARSQVERLKASSPNVVFVIWDTVRSASLALYGQGPVETPNLKRLSERGLLFRNAFATAPWTLPTHASLFTGRLPSELHVGFRDEPLDDRFVTVAEHLAGMGYATGGFVANVLYCDSEHGLAQGFQTYRDYRITPGQILLSSSLGRRLLQGRDRFELSAPLRALRTSWPGRKNAGMVTAEFLAWVEGRAGQPFFAFLKNYDAHEPYEPPASYAEARLRTISIPGRLDLAKRAVKRVKPEGDFLVFERTLYEAGIAYLDAELGRLLDELQRRNLLDNTIVVITSDHGEEFREAGNVGHASAVNIWQTHVPLVIAYGAGIQEPRQIELPVSLRDMPATIMHLLGETQHPFPGVSLVSLAADSVNIAPSPAISELDIPGSARQTSQAVRRGGYSYQRNLRGEAKLFRLSADVRESVDVTNRKESAPVIAELSALLPPFSRKPPPQAQSNQPLGAAH